MEVKEVDPVSGHKTTGHIWNGIRELDTPIPRGVLMFLIATHVFAVLWWFLMPTWPLGSTYTKGLLGEDQRSAVSEALTEGAVARVPWTTQIETLSFDQIRADDQLMASIRATGHRLFGDNCAACHGRQAKGGVNFPNLTDNDWLWGGGPEAIQQTLIVGINSTHPDSRVSQMPSFGKDGVLDRQQVRDVATYVLSLSDVDVAKATPKDQLARGLEIFQANCVACHGDNAKGNIEVGAPNLTDRTWLYGGSLQAVVNTVHGGRQGHMPTWAGRLSPTDIKLLALYVDDLSRKEP